MSSQLREIAISEMNEPDIFHLIDKEWMLIGATGEGGFNPMTASWGGLGILWNKKVAFTFIRPQRYTFGFAESGDTYTLNFFSEEYRPALALCGSKSGREVDKVKETGLTPVVTPEGTYFKEARLVLCCKKLYSQFLDPACFIDPSIQNNYPGKDYHKMFIGEIVKVLKSSC